MSHPSTAVFIGAHPDDIELGCGGTIAKLRDLGKDVHCIIVTEGTVGYQSDANRRLRAAETAAALEVLGVDAESIHQWDFPDTELDTVPIANLIREIEGVVSRIKPDRVYTMFREDRHQDHRVIFHASDVACRSVPQILVYETPSAYPNFVPTLFEQLAPEHLARKREALDHHRSQGHRIYMQLEAIQAAATFRGVQIGIPNAEGFIPHKFVL